MFRVDRCRLNRRDKSRTGRGPEDPRKRDSVEDGAGVPAPSRPKSDNRFVALGAAAADAENAVLVKKGLMNENCMTDGVDLLGVNAVTEGLHIPDGIGVPDGSDVHGELDMQDGLDVLSKTAIVGYRRDF